MYSRKSVGPTRFFIRNHPKPPITEKRRYKAKCDELRDLVPFVQFLKHEKYPWRSINFSKVAGLKPAN